MVLVNLFISHGYKITSQKFKKKALFGVTANLNFQITSYGLYLKGHLPIHYIKFQFDRIKITPLTTSRVFLLVLCEFYSLLYFEFIKETARKSKSSSCTRILSWYSLGDTSYPLQPFSLIFYVHIKVVHIIHNIITSLSKGVINLSLNFY